MVASNADRSNCGPTSSSSSEAESTLSRRMAGWAEVGERGGQGRHRSSTDREFLRLHQARKQEGPPLPTTPWSIAVPLGISLSLGGERENDHGGWDGGRAVAVD